MEIIILGENTCDYCRLRAGRTYGIKPRENAPVALVMCHECLSKLSKAFESVRGEKIKKEVKDD